MSRGGLTGSLLDLPGDVRDQVLREVGSVLDEAPAAASCLLTGSLAEGLGNSRSDIDVYLVVPGDDRARAASTAIGLRADRYVDCEYMSVGALVALAARIGAHADPGATLELTDVDRFYRVAIACQYVVDPTLTDVLSQFDRTSACSASARYFAAEAAVEACRAEVLLASGEGRRAAGRLRQAVLARATSELAVDGEGYPSTKWVFEKAARCWGPDDGRFHELVTACGCDVAAAPALLGSLQGFVERARSCLPGRADRSLRIAADVAFVAQSGTCALVRGSRSVREVTGATAVVCSSMAQGASYGAATDETAAGMGLAAWKVRLALRRGVDALYAEGYLDSEDERGRA